MSRAGERPGSPGVRRAPGFRAALQRLVRERWRSWELPGEPPRRLVLLFLGHYPLRTKVVLILRPEDRRPTLMGRLVRSPVEPSCAPRREFHLLRELTASLPAELREDIPRPLYYGLCCGEEIALYTALGGEPLWEKIGRDLTWGGGGRVRRRLIDAAAWLLAFHRATRVPPAVRGENGHGPGFGRGALLEPLKRVRQVHRLSSLGRELVEQVEHEIHAASGQRIPSVCEHGDYWMGNMLVSPGRLGILDWEGGRTDGVPLLDLLHLLHTTAIFQRNQAMDRSRLLESYRMSHFEYTWVCDVARPLLGQYARAIGVSREFARPLFPVLLARLAVREFAYAGGSVRLDELWRDCLEIFAERRSQFGWLDEIPLYRDLITPGEAPGEPAAAPEPSRASR